MITIPRLFLHVMISVDRFDIITPQETGKGIKKEKILYWLGVLVNPTRTLLNTSELSNNTFKHVG